MSLFLGSAQWAIATVVASFMGGLALGSYWGGRLADRLPVSRLPRAYALLEAGVALFGVSSPFLVHGAQVLGLKAGLLSLPFWPQTIVWFFIGFALFAFGTALMGATTPVLVRWYAHQNKTFGTAVGRLYAANTLGGVLGVAACGFYLVEHWGLFKSLLCAGAVNALCAGLVWLLPSENPGSDLPPTQNAGSSPARPLSLGILFLSGLGAMICQIGWTRAMTLVVGSSVYSFSVILLCFLSGLTLGGFFASRLLAHQKPSWNHAGLIAGILAGVILLVLPLFNQLPYFLVRLYPLTADRLIPLGSVHLFLCSLVVLAPTVLMGLFYPWALSCSCGPEEKSGSSFGTHAAANVLGVVVGALLTGFVLIPGLGIESSLLAAVIVYGLASLLSWSASESPKKRLACVLTVALLAAGVALDPPWDPHALSSGVFLYAPAFRHLKSYRDFSEDVNRNQVLYHKDGPSSTITVLEEPWGNRFLRVNGKTDASTGTDMSTQWLLAYAPRLVLSRPPKKIMVIGLGSGVSSGSCATDKAVERIDCVEIEPAVRKAASFFSTANRWVLEDPRFHLIFADARHQLTGSRETYDMIISEPSNPWIAGVAALYTREAFELVRQRLEPETGVFCQWIHSYSMGEKDFKMILATFQSVFPHTLLLTSASKDFLILGSASPLVFDFTNITKTWKENPSMAEDMRQMGFGHPFGFLAAAFVLDEADLKKYVEGSPLQSDDTMALEFSAPRFLFKGDDSDILSGLQQAKTALLPAHITGLDLSSKEWALLYNLAGETFMRLKNAAAAGQWFEKAAQTGPPDARTWTNLARIANIQNQDLKAEELYKKAIRTDPAFPLPYFHLGQLYVVQGLEDKGLPFLEKGMALAPYDPMGSFALGGLYMRRGRLANAKKVFEQSLSSGRIPSPLKEQMEQAVAAITAEQNKRKI